MRTARLLALLLIALVVAAESQAQFQVASPDGKAAIKIGVLGQVQGEWIDNADGETTAQNLFIRRLRLIFGGKLGENLTFFIDTDSPNIGKAGADGKKNEPNIYIQDVIVTYAVSKTWRIDTGMLLLPLSYHTGQGATSLLGLDYGPWAFVSSGPTSSRVGRDYGLELRGYPFGQHLEMRGGVFQGIRGTGSRNPLRAFGRVVYYPFEAQTDYFYTGTSLGKRKLLGVGASYDHQDDYDTLGGDIFLDLPTKGGAVTAQLNYCRFDGGTLIPDLPRQDVWFLEAGYFVKQLNIEPFGQYSRRDFEDDARPDETFAQLGVAWWKEGHKLNLKLGAARLEKDRMPDRTQVLAQLQLLLF